MARLKEKRRRQRRTYSNRLYYLKDEEKFQGCEDLEDSELERLLKEFGEEVYIGELFHNHILPVYETLVNYANEGRVRLVSSPIRLLELIISVRAHYKQLIGKQPFNDAYRNDEVLKQQLR